MRKPYLLFWFSGLLCLSSACTHYYYAPNSMQAPFLQDRNDTRLMVGGLVGDQFSGWEAQGVYSPVKYGAVMVNYMSVASDRSSSETNWGRGRLVEVALGGYYPASKYATFSLFGGWGAGNAYNVFDMNAVANLKFQKRFLQPGIAFQGKWARVATALRFNQLEYIKGDIDYQVGEPDLTTIRKIEAASPIYLPEISFTFGFGYRPFWGNMHLNFTNLDHRDDLNFADFTWGVSFNIEVDQLWRKQQARRENR